MVWDTLPVQDCEEEKVVEGLPVWVVDRERDHVLVSGAVAVRVTLDAVRVGERERVRERLRVPTGEGEAVVDSVGVGDSEADGVGLTVRVGVALGGDRDWVARGERLGVLEGLGVGVGVGRREGVGLRDGVGLRLNVQLADAERVVVGRGVALGLPESDSVLDRLPDRDGLGVCEMVCDALTEAVKVWLGVVVQVGLVDWLAGRARPKCHYFHFLIAAKKILPKRRGCHAKPVLRC